MRLPMCYPVVAPAFLTQAADFRSSLLPMDMSSLVASSRQRRNPSLGQQDAVHFPFVMFVAVSPLRPVTMLDTMVAMPNRNDMYVSVNVMRVNRGPIGSRSRTGRTHRSKQENRRSFFPMFCPHKASSFNSARPKPSPLYEPPFSQSSGSASRVRKYGAWRRHPKPPTCQKSGQEFTPARRPPLPGSPAADEVSGVRTLAQKPFCKALPNFLNPFTLKSGNQVALKHLVFRPVRSSTHRRIKLGNYRKLAADIFLSGWEAWIPCRHKRENARRSRAD